MKSSPIYKKIEIVAGCSARWTYRQYRCRLQADADGITIDMKGGNAQPGHPGEGFTFHRACNSLDEALAVVNDLPSSFGPDDCERQGFKRTAWVIFD